MKIRFAVGTAAVAAVLLIAGCAPSAQEPAPSASQTGPSGTINVGVPLDVTTFNPHMSPMGPMMTYLTPVYDTLIRRTATGELVPSVASNFEYTDDDNLVFELTLRDDVVFADGSAVDAEAVKANIEDAQAAGGPFSIGLSNVTDVTAADSTVTITLSDRVPNLENTLAGPAGMLVEPAALGTDGLKSTPAGSGPYTLESTSVAGTTYVLKAREDYWNPDAFGPAELNLQVLSDTDARLNALVSGQVDATVVFVQQAATAESSGLTVLSQPLNFYGIGLLDRAGTMVPALGDVRVRQALNYAVDREAIVAATAFGYGDPSTQLFPSDSPAYSEEAADMYGYDPEKAKELLEEAGFGEGLTIPVFTEARFSSYLEAVDGYLRDVGVTLDITTADAGLIASWSSGDYAATMVTYGGNDPYAILQTWAFPTSPNNPFGTELPDVDELQQAISDATTDEELAAAYQAVSAAMTEDAWFLGTNTLDTLYAFDPKRVSGIESYSGNSVPYVYGWQAAS